MIAAPQPRVAHPFRSHRKEWVIERSETASTPLRNRQISNIEDELRIPTTRHHRLLTRKLSPSSIPYSLLPTPCLSEVD
jgi:hypothetical protein